MSPEPLQVLFRYGECVDSGKYKDLSLLLSIKVGSNLSRPDIAKQYSKVSEVVDLDNISPISKPEILTLSEDDLTSLLSELTTSEWELLDEVLRNFLPEESFA